MLNKILLVLFFLCSSSCVWSYEGVKIRIEKSGLTLGQVAEIFYESSRMWPLLAGFNFNQDHIMQEDTVLPVNSTLNLVPPELCVEWMNYSCLQVADYFNGRANKMTWPERVQKTINRDSRNSKMFRLA